MHTLMTKENEKAIMELTINFTTFEEQLIEESIEIMTQLGITPIYFCS